MSVVLCDANALTSCELRSAWLTDALTHAITRENTRVKTDVHASYIWIWPDYVARAPSRLF